MRGAAGLLWLLLGACAAPPPKPAVPLAPRVELTTVPFFPQRRGHCGPAALAALLRHGGVATHPDLLAPQVYLPARGGSLAAEITAAVRRHRRLPWVLPPARDALYAAVAAGRPVLVLQNLGLSWAPRWHYAVLVGYDLEAETVVLRSGAERRHVVPRATFEHTWDRAGRWALIALRPGELPPGATPEAVLAEYTELERLGYVEAAGAGYRAIVARWPDAALAWFALAGAEWRLGRLQAAERALLETLSRRPDWPPALNNLAELRLAQGRLAEAERLAEAALAAGGAGPHADAYRDTLARVRAARGR